MCHKTKPNQTKPIGITVIFLLHYFFLVLKQDPSFCLSNRFLLFSLCGLLERQNPQDEKFFFSCKLKEVLVFAKIWRKSKMGTTQECCMLF